jgi:hypothetical protein
LARREVHERERPDPVLEGDRGEYVPLGEIFASTNFAWRVNAAIPVGPGPDPGLAGSPAAEVEASTTAATAPSTFEQRMA